MLSVEGHFLFDLSDALLDKYPHGIITLRRDGTIVRYNRAEAEFARRNQARTIGRNFWTDVAPCTAVDTFKGRFDDFAARRTSGIDHFAFTFEFAWGHEDAHITLVRKAGVEEIHILVRPYVKGDND